MTYSLLAPWIGGAGNFTPESQKGYRSLLAFWAGGACNSGIAPIPQDDFQILGGVRSYDDDDIERLRRQYEKNARELHEIDQKISAEQEKIDKLQNLNDNIVQVDAFEADQADALYLAAVAQAQIEIKRLQSMKAALMRMLDEEEAILAILLSHPFYH